MKSLDRYILFIGKTKTKLKVLSTPFLVAKGNVLKDIYALTEKNLFTRIQCFIKVVLESKKVTPWRFFYLTPDISYITHIEKDVIFIPKAFFLILFGFYLIHHPWH